MSDRNAPISIKPQASNAGEAGLASGFSIEVMPRTAAKIDDFRAILPAGTRVYVANIEGTPEDDMIATAARIRRQGFAVMPHVTARGLAGPEALETQLRRYRDEADVSEALVLAGGNARPAGTFTQSMDLLETGLFDRLGYTRLHVAGHPEGNRDIDSDGGFTQADSALVAKQGFARNTDAEMAIVTQFFFDAAPVIEWAHRLRDKGVELPIHAGLAGPAKLQTLIKYAMACGVGPSLSVLRKRAMDMTKLLVPFDPKPIADALDNQVEAHKDCPISSLHLFPLGGIRAAAEWANARNADRRQAGAA